MGLTEVLAHLPRLLRLRRRLRRDFDAWRPDVFVGIDAPEFNLGLAARLHAAGIRTVQYVSPQVWAWRQGRVRTIARSCDLVLCLLPFEPAFYARHAVRAEFVGHPLADQVPLEPDRAAARRALRLPDGATIVALLPGSRRGEVSAWPRLSSRRPARWRARAPTWCSSRRWPTPRCANCSSGPRARARVRRRCACSTARHASRCRPRTRLSWPPAPPRLEALLCNCPMVVAYRLSAVTAFLLRSLRLVRLPYFSLPNLLAGEALVPEFFQEQVSGERLATAVLQQLNDPARRQLLATRFRAIHASLRQGGAARAAAAVLRLVPGR